MMEAAKGRAAAHKPTAEHSVAWSRDSRKQMCVAAGAMGPRRAPTQTAKARGRLCWEAKVEDVGECSCRVSSVPKSAAMPLTHAAMRVRTDSGPNAATAGEAAIVITAADKAAASSTGAMGALRES